MIQNIIISIIIAACAWFIGRRMYKNLKNSDQGCGSGCGCSGCGPDVVSNCQFPSSDPESK